MGAAGAATGAAGAGGALATTLLPVHSLLPGRGAPAQLRMQHRHACAGHTQATLLLLASSVAFLQPHALLV